MKAEVHLTLNQIQNRNLIERDTIDIIIVTITDPVEEMIVGREDTIKTVGEMKEKGAEADEIMLKNN